MIYIFIIACLIIACICYYGWKTGNDAAIELENDVREIIDNHMAFVQSLSPRQLEYYNSLDHNHMSRELVKLEQRVYDLEQPNLPH